MRRIPQPWFGSAVFVALSALWGAGCTDTFEPRWVEIVRPVPDSIHLVPGETATFGVEVLDQNGKKLTDDWAPRVEWTIVNPSVTGFQVLDVGVSVTALKPGTARVRAELGRGRGEAVVHVQPPGLDRVELDPSPPIRASAAYGNPRVWVRLFDSDGIEISPAGFHISWQISDTTVATYYSPPNANWASIRPRSAGQTRLLVSVGRTYVAGDVIVTHTLVPPSAPTVNTLSSSSLEVIWVQAPGANSGYRVFRAASPEGTYTHIASTGGATFFAFQDTTYVDTDLSPSTTHFYQIEACRVGVGCSERSAHGSGTTASGG